MPHSRDAEGYYVAAARFVDECLRSGGSLFTPGKPIWATPSVAELYERFVENPDEEKNVDFAVKLVGQLDGSSADVYQLAAEMLYILLVPQHTDAATRRKQVDTVLAASPDPVELPDDLAAGFDGGIASYGAALTRRFEQYVFLCEFARAWVALEANERDRLLADASAFRDFVFQLPRKGASSQVEALLHMVFPDSFEPIVSVEVKEKIARAFADYSPDPSAPIDQQLASIRAALEEEVGAGFDFYDDELRALWDVPVSTGRRAWIVRGERAYGTNLVPRWLEEGFVSMGAAEEGRIEPGMTVKEIIDLVQQARPEMTRQQIRGGATSGRYFASEISVGDYVLTRDGENVYVGRVTSDQEFVSDDQPGTARRRHVEWLNRDEPFVWADLPKSLRERATNPNTVWELKGEVDVIRELVGDEEDSSAALWEPFLHWAERLYEHESFDAEERDYKLVVAEDMRVARQALLDGDEDWLPKLRRAFSRSALTSFYAHGRFLDWCSEDQQRSAAFLRDIWTQETFPPSTVSRLVASWPDTPNNGTGNRLSIVSVLLMGIDARQHPPYKTVWVDKAFGLLGLPTRGAVLPEGEVELEPEEVAHLLGVSGLSVRNFLRERFPRTPEAKGTRYGPLPHEQLDAIFEHFGRASTDSNEDAGRRYASFLALLDEIVDRMRSRGVELRDRLDAQSLGWWITSAEPPADWSEEEKEAFLMYQGGSGAVSDDGDTPSDLEALARALLLDPVEWLEEVAQLLFEKRQIILYGPPGTGKTFIAQALAEHLTRNGGAFELIQFHPSYSYEDFFEGYRPQSSDGQLTYVLAKGPLRRIAAEAAEDSGNPYILIVDEINRGNVAKIFGELLFLLEYRDREITLQHSREETFSLPPNLYLIGTMNTADRSIALVDTALRRRFYFVECSPNEPPISGVLGNWLAKHDLDDEADRALSELNRRLSTNELSIGPSYFMTPNGSEPNLERVWQHSIMPLLEEYFYGTETDVTDEFGLQRILGALDGNSELLPVLEEEPSPES